MEEFIPDVEQARKDIVYRFFSEYSEAYITTNENLRNSMKYMPKNCNRALTVAASGDHPLFCSLYGAKHVDTFDVSYNAKCIMDIKTAAFKCLKYSDYVYLLKDLQKTRDVKSVPNMDKILPQLSPFEYDYMCAMYGYTLFDHGSFGDNHENFVTESEYNQLKETVKQPYNFMMTNMACLDNYLTQSYDFMHTSNVFDYVFDVKHQIALLGVLLKHLNVGGRIVIQHLCKDPWDKTHFAFAPSWYAGDFLKKTKFIQALGDVSIFERVR